MLESKPWESSSTPILVFIYFSQIFDNLFINTDDVCILAGLYIVKHIANFAI